MPLRRSCRCTRLTLLTAPRVRLLPGRYWSSCAAISRFVMLTAGLAVAGSCGGDAVAPSATTVEVIAALAISAAARREVLRMDISSPFREVSGTRRPRTRQHTLRQQPAGRKVVLTVFSAPPYSRLI